MELYECVCFCIWTSFGNIACQIIFHQAQMKFEMNKCQHRYDDMMLAKILRSIFLFFHVNRRGEVQLALNWRAKLKQKRLAINLLVWWKLSCTFIVSFLFAIRSSSTTLSYMRWFAKQQQAYVQLVKQLQTLSKLDINISIRIK